MSLSKPLIVAMAIAATIASPAWAEVGIEVTMN